jgi:uncharacterized coiled-coil protein SlyX
MSICNMDKKELEFNKEFMDAYRAGYQVGWEDRAAEDHSEAFLEGSAEWEAEARVAKLELEEARQEIENLRHVCFVLKTSYATVVARTESHDFSQQITKQMWIQMQTKFQARIAKLRAALAYIHDSVGHESGEVASVALREDNDE